MKFDNVLVPIDGSFLSEVAVDLAIHSAGTFATHLTFVYVADISQYNAFGTIDGTAVAYKLRTEGRMALEHAENLAKGANLEYEAKLIEGIPWEVLSKMSKDFDMMIMGVTGKSGFSAGRVGSTAAKVIENSYCPVLTLKSGSTKIKDILLPVSDTHMAAIDVAMETAKRVDGRVMVFAVKSKVNAEELVKEVASKFTAEGIPVDTKVAEGDIVDDIIAMSGMYDLVVMGTEGRRGLKKILNGSVAEHVMTHALCPVTIVRDT